MRKGLAFGASERFLIRLGGASRLSARFTKTCRPSRKSSKQFSVQKFDDVAAEAFFEEFGTRAGFFDDEPARGFRFGGDEEEFFVGPSVAEVADERGGQPAAAHDAVARRARPARLDRERAKPPAQDEPLADHRRVADAEAVRFAAREREARADAIQLASERGEGVEQPRDGARAHSIVGGLQVQVVEHVAATARRRARARLFQLPLVLFVEAAQTISLFRLGLARSIRAALLAPPPPAMLSCPLTSR